VIQSLPIRQNHVTLQRVTPAISGIEFHGRLNLSEGREGANQDEECGAKKRTLPVWKPNRKLHDC
jgi:hypothetical protein